MTRAYKVEFARSAAKSLSKIDRTEAQRIYRAIDNLATNPEPPGSTQLVGGDGQRRIRVGDYRVIYRVEHGVLVVFVIRVAHRREVYR